MTRAAGLGDRVMMFRATKSLPNIVGKADVFDRATNAGRTSLRFIGAQGDRAVFERHHVVETDATTMSRTPMVAREQTRPRVDGSIAPCPVTATTTSTRHPVIAPRSASTGVTTSRPIHISLAAGQSTTIEGRRLTVVKVGAASLHHRID